MPSRLRFTLAVLVAIVLPALCAPPAHGGTYTVRECDYAAGIGRHDFRWQEAGTPRVVVHAGSGCGEFGLGARNGNAGRAQTYPSGGYGGWFAYAPPGTVFTAFSGAFGVLDRCCVSGMAAYAEATANPDGTGPRAYLFQGDLGNRTFEAPSGLGGPVGRGWSAAASGFAARRVGFHLRCGPGFSCFQSTGGDMRVRGRSFDFTLRDDIAPRLAAPSGTLLAGGWLRGVRTLAFSASDGGGGLTGVEASLDGGGALRAGSACAVVAGRYAALRPCPLGRSGSWSLDTARVPDGRRTLTVRATDVGGATATQTRTVLVDNGAPAAPRGAAVAGGGGWRRTNGFVVGWDNPPGQHAPIARAHFSACPVGGGVCLTGARDADGVTQVGPIALPHGGEWDLRVRLEDAAGNSDPDATSEPLRLRFDPDPPRLRFVAADGADPTLVELDAGDRSGIARVAIELRRRGAAEWRPLATARAGGRLTARIDDVGLAWGVYELRARAVDRAGNAALAYGPDRVLPLRSESRLRAAILARAPRGESRCRPAHGARRATCRRCRRSRAGCRGPAAVRRRAVTVRHGSTVVVRGSLTTAAGRPLAGRRVGVTLVSGDRRRALPDVRADAGGGIVLALTARRSARVALDFAGDASALPDRASVALRVPAPVTISARTARSRVARGRDRARRKAGRARERRVVRGRDRARRNARRARPGGARRPAAGGRVAVRPGEAVRFGGRVRGGGIPRGGKLVEVQAHFRGRWRTISSLRSSHAGRWRFRYAFRASGRRATYRLRARVPAEAGYPFAAGVSRPVAVTVSAR